MAKHIHIHFAPRKRIGDQAPGSVPPSDLKPLVEALHAAIAARQGATQTKDADFDESKVKRDEGGRFSAQQHMDAAAKHHSDADTHKAAGNAPAAKAHTEAAMEHEMAAQHINAKTGWAAHRSQSAHNKSAEAAKLSASTPASLDQLKAQASDPKASIEQRAAAVSQLSKMEKMANTVAESPHAIPQAAQPSQQPVVQAPAGGVAPQAQPATAKPTSAKASGAKAATHELLSSGHPFSVDELMKATGCSNRTTLMTALSDLKSPKYAGKLGALNIVKRPDGMYHVQKDDGKPVGKVSADNPYGLDDSTRAGLAKLAPKIAAQQGAATTARPASGTRTRAELDAEMAPGAPGRLKPGDKHDMVTMANEQTDAYVKGGGGLNPYAKGTLQYNQVEARRAEYAASAPKPTRLPTLNPYTNQPLSPEVQAKMAQEAPHYQKEGGVDIPSDGPGFSMNSLHGHIGHEASMVPRGGRAASSLGGHVAKNQSGDTKHFQAHEEEAAKAFAASPRRVGPGNSAPRKPATKAEHAQAKPSTSSGPSPDPKTAAPKHVPVKSAAWGNPVIPGYTSHKSAVQPKGTHRQAGKEIPASSHEVYHNGQHIGTVQSYSGHRDGPKIGGHVVAWRKDQVQHSFTPKGEAMRELSKHLYPATHFTVGSTSASEAIRRGVEWHQAALARKAQADKAGK